MGREGHSRKVWEFRGRELMSRSEGSEKEREEEVGIQGKGVDKMVIEGKGNGDTGWEVRGGIEYWRFFAPLLG